MIPIASAKPGKPYVYAEGRRWLYYMITVGKPLIKERPRPDYKKEREMLVVSLLGEISLICKTKQITQFIKNLGDDTMCRRQSHPKVVSSLLNTSYHYSHRY